MTHCEENREAEAVIGEEEFVEEENPNVGRIPEDDERGDEDGFLLQQRHLLRLFCGEKPMRLVGRSVVLSIVGDALDGLIWEL